MTTNPRARNPHIYDYATNISIKEMTNLITTIPM